MSKIVKYGLLILLLNVGLSAIGQEVEKEGEVFVSNNFKSSNSSIYIKWISKHVYFPEGCIVYRQEVGQNNWEKLNTDLIKFSQTPVNGGTSFDEDSKNLYESAKQMSYPDFKESILRAFLTIKAIYNNDLALSIGMGYIDETAERGKSYMYRVVGIENGQELEIGISPEIMVAEYVKTDAPKSIVIDRKRKQININWEPELLRYYAVDIYRKSENEKEFTKITKIPRAITKVENREGEMVLPEVFYTDLEFDKKLSYSYKFVAIDYFGQTSIESDIVNAFYEDLDPPLPPVNVSVFPYAKELKVELKWEAPVTTEDIYGYNVYRSSKLDGPFNLVNDEPLYGATDFMDELSNPGGYYYYVSSLDFAGNEGKSGKVFMDLKDIQPPAAPSGFKTSADTGMIKMTWNPNSEGDLLGYFIQRSLNDEDLSDNKYINVNAKPITSTEFTQKLAKKIKNKFVYRVVAVDTSFNYSQPSSNSLGQMPDVIAPAIPVIKFIRPENNVLKVEWLPNIEKDLKGYNLYRSNLSKDSVAKQVNFSLIPSTLKYYEVRDLVYDDKFEYTVTAVDESGNESEKSKPFTYILKSKKDSLSETFELSFKQNTKKKNVKLTWEEVDDAKGYVVFHSADGEQFSPISGMLTGISNFVVSKLEGVNYYQVRCYNKEGKKILSNRIELNN